MLVRILGIIDILAGLFLLFGINYYLNSTFLIIFGLIILAKSSLGLLKDIASWIDFLVGIIFLLLTIISLPGYIFLFFAILILQKGILSFF